jgi:WD40 repeat protein
LSVICPTPVSALKGCPYPGLRSFTRDESELFFGRDNQIDQLLELLQEVRFLTVVGPSGCGKSSLIKAGLMADLEGGLMSYAGARWEMAEMRPGNHPFAALADALLAEEPLRSRLLTRSTPNPEAVIGFLRAALRVGPAALTEVLRESKLPPDTNYFLLVDQFEEIFAARREGAVDETDAFVALLLATAAQTDLPVYVVLTMRTDWLGECPVFQGLPEEINRSLFLAPRLTREEKREAIVGPARLFGGSISEELVNHLLNKTGPNPDQLPLLQHVLMRMWQLASEGPDRVEPICLTHEHYRAAGGFEKGLSKHAGEAYGDLTEEQKRVAQVLFRALSQYGPEGRERRRFATVGDIAELAGVPAQEVAKVADAFRRSDRSFLTPPPNQPLTSDSILDISHEALIRNWDKLAEWAAAEDRSARRFQWLKQTAYLERSGEASLLHGTALDNILDWRKSENPSPDWAKRYGGDFELAMSFLDRSEQTRRSRHKKAILWRVWVCGIVAVALVMGGAIYAIPSLLELHNRSERFLGKGRLRLENTSRSPVKHTDALRDFARALKCWPRKDAAKEAARLLSLNWCPPLTPPLVYKPDAPLLAAAFGPGNEPIAVSDDGSLLRWKRNDPNPSESKSLIKTSRITSAAFSSDGKRLLFTPSTQGGDAELWMARGGDFAYHHWLDLTNKSGTKPSIRQALWSSDHRVLIVISGRLDKPVFDAFELRNEIYVPVSPNPFRNAVAANFDHSGRVLATVDESGDVQLWDANTLSPFNRIPVTVATETRVSSIAFIPGTSYLVASGFRGGYWIDTKSGAQGPISSPLPQDVFMKFAFAPHSPPEVRFAVGLNGRIVVASAKADALDLNKAMGSSSSEPIAIRGLSGIPVFSHDGNELLTLSGTVWNAWDTLRIWDVSGPKASEATVEFDKLNHVPAWLSDLAIAVSGAPLCDDEEVGPVTLERIRENARPQDIRGPYAYIWRRFFGDLPPGQKARTSLSWPASARNPRTQTTATRPGGPP